MQYTRIIEGLERRWQRDMATAGPQWRRERDRAILELQRAGLTAAEALRLELEDVEDDGRVTVTIRRALPAEAAKAVRKWLKIREDDPEGTANRIAAALDEATREADLRMGVTPPDVWTRAAGPS